MCRLRDVVFVTVPVYLNAGICVHYNKRYGSVPCLMARLSGEFCKHICSYSWHHSSRRLLMCRWRSFKCNTSQQTITAYTYLLHHIHKNSLKFKTPDHMFSGKSKQREGLSRVDCFMFSIFNFSFNNSLRMYLLLELIFSCTKWVYRIREICSWMCATRQTLHTALSSLWPLAGYALCYLFCGL